MVQVAVLKDFSQPTLEPVEILGLRNMSVAYQSWEVGTGPKVYQCVMDAAPFRWQQQSHTENTKATLSSLSMYINNSQHETSEPKPCGAQSGSPVSRLGDCGPVSSFVIPVSSCPGCERVPVIGEDLDATLNANRCASWHGQRSLRGGCSFAASKVHPHEHDFDTLDETAPRLTTDCLVVPTMSPSLFRDCVGPALSSSSSSIGAGEEHSFSSSENDTGDAEVQSSLRVPLNLSSLEDSLPIKRGLSRYFTGQSKSFGCLADALSTSLAKPANPYAKRRKSLAIYDDRQRSCPPLSRTSASGISKKTSFGNRSNLALAVAMESAVEEEEEEEEENEDLATPLPRMGWGRYKSNAFPSRSYSLSDLQDAAPTRKLSLVDFQSTGRN